MMDPSKLRPIDVGSPPRMPELEPGEVVIARYDPGGKALFVVCETQKDMTGLHDNHEFVEGLKITWYIGPDPYYNIK